jgi:hypothetical protein
MLRIGFKTDGTKLLEHNNEGTSHVKSMMEGVEGLFCLPYYHLPTPLEILGVHTKRGTY